MADWTPQQLQQMNAVVMGTHDKLTPGGQIQPGYSLDQIYGGILPAASASRPAMASNQPTPAQLAAMKAIPAGAYQTPPNRPILSPNTPAGSQFQDTGNYGRASGSMLQQLMLAGQQQPLNINVRGGQQPIGSKMGNQLFGPPMAPNVPLPRPRPGYAPTILDMAAINRPVGANPGMGGAMIGDGVMAPGIPPQGPPPPGIAPTVWAGDNQQPVNIAVRGGRQPRLTSAQQYALANEAARQAALQRQAAATGSTGVYNYVNGVKAGTVNGQSSANAYAAANAGPGSVAAFEQKASGRPAGSYSDGREPSGTGSLW